jgi:hypothetical protein
MAENLENVKRIVAKMMSNNEEQIRQRKKHIRAEIAVLSKTANEHELRSMHSWTR